MKKLLLLFIPLSLMLISGICFSQVQGQAQQTKVEVSSTNIEKEDRREPFKEIDVELNIDFSKYTTIAVVSAKDTYADERMSLHDDIKNILVASPFTVILPYEFDKKRYKQNKNFLKEIKNEDWLYLYFNEEKSGVDLVHRLIIRNSSNQVVYSVRQINMTRSDVLYAITKGS